jgi:hypothetical protein
MAIKKIKTPFLLQKKEIVKKFLITTTIIS